MRISVYHVRSRSGEPILPWCVGSFLYSNFDGALTRDRCQASDNPRRNRNDYHRGPSSSGSRDTTGIRLCTACDYVRQQNYTCGAEPARTLKVLPHPISEVEKKLGHVIQAEECVHPPVTVEEMAIDRVTSVEKRCRRYWNSRRETCDALPTCFSSARPLTT